MAILKIRTRPGTDLAFGEGILTEEEAAALRRELEGAEDGETDPRRRILLRRALDRLATTRTHFTAGGLR